MTDPASDDLPEYDSRHPTPTIKSEVHWIGFVIALGTIALLVRCCG